ncbi:MAG: hypothetical protein RLZZ306_797 [Bacteroidota bacterium]
MKIKFPKYLFILLLLVASCITPITDFTQISSTSFLTVEASLTDQVGPQSVKLYTSSDKLTGGFFLPITRAKVFVTDEKGVREDFTESFPSGTFTSSSKFVGRVGSTYTLNIEMADGKKYKSQPETMKPVPEIENVLTRFEVNDNYSKGDSRRGGFNIYLDFQDPATAGDNYQWYWKHYERAFICETCSGGATYDFRTNTCVSPRTPSDVTLNYRCDGDCWNISLSTDLNILSDTYLNGQRITGKQVARVPFDGVKPYYLQLEQRAITRNSYNYYQALTVQTQSNGTLFDVPAETKFSFNIKSTTNPSEKILGIFDVYSVRKRIFYIDRTNVPNGESPVSKAIQGQIFSCVPPLPGCREVVQCSNGLFRTPFKPEGWKD